MNHLTYPEKMYENFPLEESDYYYTLLEEEIMLEEYFNYILGFKDNKEGNHVTK